MKARVRSAAALAGAWSIALLAGCGFIDDLTRPEGLTIQRFAVTPTQVTTGRSATLAWEVQGAEVVEIDNGIGVVSPEGSKQVEPPWTTTYTLRARAGTSSATATVQVIVQGDGSPGPSPSAAPSPSLSPSPSPSPGSSPEPGPSPSPMPPEPSPSPTPLACGVPATSAGNCALTIVKPEVLPAGGCIELNAVTVNQSCPVAVNTTRSLQFEVTARTERDTLRWRRAASSSDLLIPEEGQIAGDGRSTVLLSDVVLDSTVTLEIQSGDDVVLSFTLRHY